MIDLIPIIGFAAGCCTTGAFAPQVLQSLKTKETKDLSMPMLAITVVGDSLWLIYGFMANSVPIVAANAATLVLVLTLVYLKFRYG